jgi:hypothetical protein
MTFAGVSAGPLPTSAGGIVSGVRMVLMAGRRGAGSDVLRRDCASANSAITPRTATAVTMRGEIILGSLSQISREASLSHIWHCCRFRACMAAPGIPRFLCLRQGLFTAFVIGRHAKLLFNFRVGSADTSLT